MRTKKIKNSIESESESKMSHLSLLNQDSNADAAIDAAIAIEPVEPVEPELKINNTENIVINTIIVEKKKRGRKKLIKPDSNSDAKESTVNNGDHVENLNADAPDKKEKKQRKVRTSKQEKKKQQEQNLLQAPNKNDCNDGENNIQEESSTSLLMPELASASASAAPIIIHKKRGRKPRGGKIIHENQIQKNNSPEVPKI